jgi:N-acetylmuramoyl-L-alanine amidase
MRNAWRYRRGRSLPIFSLSAVVILSASGCARQATTAPERILVVPAREALAGYRVPEHEPSAAERQRYALWLDLPRPQYPPPNFVQPLPPPNQPPRGDAPKHPEWAVADPRPWRYIVIHHSGTDRGGAKAFNNAHLARGWENGLGYDFVIGNGTDTRDGQIEVGDRWRRQIQGAHAGVALYNEYGIGICLVGDFERYRPTARQLAALAELVNYLAQTYNVPRKNILRHSDVKDTKCPGRYFPFQAMFRS